MSLFEVIDVPEMLRALDIRNVRVGDREVTFSCPLGHFDRHPSARMNRSTTAWLCHSCLKRGNAVTLVADIADVPRTTAYRWLAERWAPHTVQIDDLRGYIERRWEERHDEPPAIREPLDEIHYTTRAVDWKLLESSSQRPAWASYMLARGISAQTLDQFQVCYDPLSDRPALTVRDPAGGLVGFKARAYLPHQEPKYRILGDVAAFNYGFMPYNAASYVFGLHLAQPVDDTLTVVEGELNVVSMHDKGFSNAVGPSGSYLSPMQIEQIVERANRVVLLFDFDSGTQRSRELSQIKILRAISDFEQYVDVFVCPEHEGDPNDMTAEELSSLVESAIPSVRYKVLQVLGR